MRTYLVVANQTLGGEELAKELRARIDEGPCRFHVVVPQTPPEELARMVVPPDPTVGALGPDGDEELLKAARKQAEHRLDRLLGTLSAAGAEADGDLGHPDPMTAIEHSLAQQDCDGIILSTLPPGISRWLGMDLGSRLERRVDIPVTVVTAG
ncbi:MAG: universal stress protein [Nitriliruptorales bacterium]